MTTDELIRELRQTATNASPSLHRLLCAAADRLEESNDAAWDVFEAITSAYGGKQIFFREKNGTVYDRYNSEYITFDEAMNRFCRLVGDEE